MKHYTLSVKVVVYLILLGLLTSCASPSAKKGDGSQMAAFAMLSQGKWKEAEEEATRAIDEGHITIRENKAAAFNCKWLTSSCEVQEEVLKSNLEGLAGIIAEMQSVRSVARVEMQDYQGARIDAEAAISIAPDDPMAHYVMVRVYDHDNDMQGVKKELIAQYGSKNRSMYEVGMMVKAHYLAKKGADWSSETLALQRITAELLKSKGWGVTKITVPVMAPPNELGSAYIYKMSLPGGWEELPPGSVPLVNQTLKRVQPVRDYDDVGAIISVVPMQAVVPHGPVTLKRYHAGFLENLKKLHYDLKTIQPFQEMNKPGKQIAFWIKSPTQSGKELLIEQKKGSYVAVLSLIVLRSYDTFIQRYKEDAQRIISSITIEKLPRLSLSERLRQGKPMTALDRYRATQEGRFTIKVNAPKGWNTIESFHDGKWFYSLGVPGDDYIFGALRVVMLKPEFGYLKSKYPDYWDFVASQSYAGLTPIPLHLFAGLKLKNGWQARISDMKYDPGRNIYVAKRQGDFVLIYTFSLVKSIAPKNRQITNAFELAAASNPTFQKYKVAIEQFAANTRFSVH